MTRVARVIRQVEILPQAQLMYGGFIPPKEMRAGSAWKCFTHRWDSRRSLCSFSFFFFLVKKRRIWNVLPVAWFILSFKNLTYLFGPAIETLLGELPQTDGQFCKEQMDESKTVGPSPDGRDIRVQAGTRV